MLREIEIETWKRRTTFEFFRDFENPFFNLTAQIDASGLYRFCRNQDLPFSLVCLYFSIQSANEVPEFRIRLVDNRLVEYQTIHATQTILNEDETFSFCYFELKDNLLEFVQSGSEAVRKYKVLKTFDVQAERLDLIYYSVIPWISFTSFKNATRLDQTMTVPRLAFGKLFAENGKMKLPHSVEVHHSMMDGIHVGKYFSLLQQKLDGL